jgi:hypothetical protein
MAAAASAAPFLGPDSPVHDTSQTAYVSPLALLKILVHGTRARARRASNTLCFFGFLGAHVRRDVQRRGSRPWRRWG